MALILITSLSAMKEILKPSVYRGTIFLKVRKGYNLN